MASGVATPAGGRATNNIGTLRLIGALFVLVGHSFALSGEGRDPISDVLVEINPFRFGLPGIGVAMFFSISGYLVAQSFLRRRRLLSYVEARVLRIFPALWCVLALTLLMGAIATTHSPGEFLRSSETVRYTIHTALLFDLSYDLPGVFTENPLTAVNGSLWTLPVELRMYGFVAVVGVVGLLGRRLAFNLLAAGLVAAYVLADGDLPMMGNPDHAEMAAFFLAGTTLVVNRDRIPIRGDAALGLFALAAVLSGTAAAHLAFAAAFAYGVLWLGYERRIRLPDLARSGDLSYATYLLAFPASQIWVSAIGTQRPWAVLVLTAGTVLPLAWLSWHVVEAPALRLKGRLGVTDRSVSYSPEAA